MFTGTGAIANHITLPFYDFQVITFFKLVTLIREPFKLYGNCYFGPKVHKSTVIKLLLSIRSTVRRFNSTGLSRKFTSNIERLKPN